MQFLQKQNKSVFLKNLLAAILIFIIAFFAIVWWYTEKLDIDNGAAELSATSEVGDFVYIDTDYLTESISSVSEDNKTLYTTHIAMHDERVIAINIPVAEYDKYDSIVENEYSTETIRIEGRLVETYAGDRDSIKELLEYWLEDEISDDELPDYAYTYTLDIGDQPNASILPLAIGIILLMAAIFYLVRGIMNLSGCGDQRKLSKDNEMRHKFEGELASVDTKNFSGLILLDSWVVIKNALKTRIISYEEVKRYYELTVKRRGISARYVAIETVDGARHKAPFSRRKDADINNIFNCLQERLSISVNANENV